MKKTPAERKTPAQQEQPRIVDVERRRAKTLATVEEAIEEYRNGRFVIIIDDEDRENEGDLTIPAQFATPEAINFMARYGRGLVCVPMTGERLEQLHIPMMVNHNDSHFGTPFSVSVEARSGVTTGISAADRARTTQVLIDPKTRPNDLVMPGHIFPLRARDGGVLVRAGQTEATVDLCKMAGLYPAGVLCEIMNDDGTMSRLPELRAFRPKACPEDHQRHAAHPVPHPQGEAGQARRGVEAADGVRASGSASPTRRSRTRTSISRSFSATSAARRRCWSACTRSA